MVRIIILRDWPLKTHLKMSQQFIFLQDYLMDIQMITAKYPSKTGVTIPVL